MSDTAPSDPILSCSVSFFLALISVLKSLKLGSHLAVSSSSFNLGDSRLVSKQKGNQCSQEDFDGKEILNLYG